MNVNEIEKKDYIEIEQEQDFEINYSTKINKIKYFKYSSYVLFLIIIIIIIIISCIILFIYPINKTKEKIDISNFNNKTIIFKKINKTQPINNYTNNYTNNHTNNTNSTNNTTSLKNKTKITIAFVYSNLYANGIARFITVTANNLIKTGKYDIYFITEKPNGKEYKFDPKIRRIFIYNHHNLIKVFSKHASIDFFILQNTLGKRTIKLYKSYCKKVIGIFHGVYMSDMFHGIIKSYRNWIEFDEYDAFIFITYDDYFFYKKLGYKNEIFIPNLYTFEPSQITNSNLTNHNILMLGRAADKVKGFLYSIKQCLI